jgi:multidrug efflux system membrane fusion protein
MFGGKTEAPEAKPVASTSGLTRVQVQRFTARPMTREVVLQGQTLARHEVVLKAEVPGTVVEVLANKGEAVKRGDILLRIGEDGRPQQLAQARALVQQRELEYQAAKSLKSKGLQAERQLAEAESLLRAAKAQLKNAQLNMARLTLRAPFDGVIQDRVAESGTYLKIGDPTFTLVNLDPLVVRGDVAEGDVGSLKQGLPATARLSNGAELTGAITFIAPVANTSTRTFAVEMEAPNPASQQPGGMSATIHVPLATMPAHKISPALLSLDDAGTLGLKTVDSDGIVRFYPVKILKSERDGIWLGGLPESVELITVGQGFVRAGEQVTAVQGDDDRP